MGHFTRETLEKFQELCAAGIDFGEEAPYDFAMCLMANGDIYGIEPGEVCEKGKPVSDEQGAKLRAAKLSAKAKGKDTSKTRMAKLKKAFLKKTGREMTKEELTKASWMVKKGK